MIDETTLLAFMLADVTKYITMGMDTAISDFFMIMNRDSFNDQHWILGTIAQWYSLMLLSGSVRVDRGLLTFALDYCAPE